MGADAARPVDIVLLTGFLGSGKTSLIRRLLESPALADTALIINEFGEVGLDQFFVRTAIENTLLMENGCVCCSIRGDLVDSIAELLARAANGEIPAFSRIIIETTGLADPGPIVSELKRTTGTQRPLRLQKVIATVDGVLGTDQIRSVDEVMAQIAHADLCLVTKAGLADANVVTALVEDVRAMNPAAHVEVLRDGPLDVQRMLGPEDAPATAPAPRRAGRLRLGPRHRAIASWSADVEAPLEWARLRDWIDLLYSLRAAELVRMKAVLNLAGHTAPLVIHGVGPLVTPPEPLDRWPGERPMSRIVVITRNLAVDIVERSFRAMVEAPARPAAHPSLVGIEGGH